MRSSRFRTLVAAGIFLPLPAGVAVGQNATLISHDHPIDRAVVPSHSIKSMRTLIYQNQSEQIIAIQRSNPIFVTDSKFIPLFTGDDMKHAVEVRGLP
jgi:hypothetical protein